MPSHQSDEQERESRMWWVLDELDMPEYVEGVRCTPANPDAWWFPTKGFSVHESQVYETAFAARRVSLERLERERDRIDRRIDLVRTGE